MALMTMYVSLETSAIMPSVCLLGLQLLDLVPKPVKANVLLFPARGELEELTNREEEEMKEKDATPVDPTVFWVKQTVRLAGVVRLSRVIIPRSDQQRMRHDWHFTCIDNCKMGQISIRVV